MKKVEIRHTRWQKRADWLSLRQWMRSEVARVLSDIERGFVNEVDFAKLNNFCVTALTLLEKVEQGTWESSKRGAELAALLRNEVQDE